MGILDWIDGLLLDPGGALATVAATLGLERRGSCAVGIVGGTRVRIDRLSGPAGACFSLSLGARRDLPGFDVRPMNGVEQLSRLIGREIASGDTAFDERTSLDGDELEIAATLDAPTRACLLRLFAEGASLIGGRVLVALVQARHVVERVERLVPHVRGLRGVPPTERVARAAANVRQDPDARVRLRNATILVEHAADAAEVNEALSMALIDADPRVRLFAARHVRATGGPVMPYRSAGVAGNPVAALVELARGPYDATLRAHAVDLLAARSTLADVGDLMDSLRDDSDWQVRQAALRALFKLK